MIVPDRSSLCSSRGLLQRRKHDIQSRFLSWEHAAEAGLRNKVNDRLVTRYKVTASCRLERQLLK